MVAAENYALNNKCAPNNEVLRISSYHSVIRGKYVNASVNVKETHRSTRQHKKPSTAWKASYVATTCTSIFGLPALVGDFSSYQYGECTRVGSYYAVSVIKDARWWATYVPRIISFAIFV